MQLKIGMDDSQMCQLSLPNLPAIIFPLLSMLTCTCIVLTFGHMIYSNRTFKPSIKAVSFHSVILIKHSDIGVMATYFYILDNNCENTI